MPHEFEVREEIALDATPEQVWEAIATGPGVDSWFMGRNTIEPREGGRTRQEIMGFPSEATVTAWEPGKKYAIRTDDNPDGTFMAMEYLIEGRGGGSAVLRFVHSGFLGDDWEAEYDALKVGDGMYLRKLAAYLRHFPGRTSAYNVFAVGPQVADKDRVWSAFAGVLGLTGTEVAEGAPGRLTVEGLAPVDGVVEFARRPGYLGLRTDEGLYMLIHGYQDAVVVEHHDFSGSADGARLDEVWQSWLNRSFA
ncbi:SRPBCC family protein [Microtetraspora malaysiensis]|uniref:SRPBCC family protein n=1 Tax=Microtetraspora malaysiensis TaxID=161358 RepID=UPI00083792C7|nr:SRPBCC domain-containing protein [Microtetraspora malaysiensis]